MSLTLLIFYTLVLLGLGFALRRRAHGRAEAYLAGRRLGPYLVAASVTATAVGGSATVGLARFVHANGVSGAWLDLPLGLALLALGGLLAARVRRTGRFSLPDVAGALYGPGFRRAAGALVVLAEVAWFALLIRAAAPFVAQLSPLGEDAAVPVVAAVFVAYTALGGQAAVAWTDGLQLALVAGLGLVLPAALVLVETDGLAGLPSVYAQFPTGGDVDATAIVGFLAMFGLPGLVGGDVWSKVLSARDEQAARRGVLLAAGLKILLTAAVVVLALGAHVLLPGLATGNDILPRTIAAALPPALASAAALGFLAAMMSSADSVLLTGATVLDIDLLPPPRSERAERLRVPAIIVGVGLGGTALALGEGDIVAIMLWAYTVFAAGAPLPILVGLVRPRLVPGWAASVALAGGGLAALAAKLWGVSHPEPVLLGLAVSAVTLTIGAAAKRLRAPTT